MPDLFSVPVKNVKAGERVQIELTWLEPVSYEDGKYQYTLPLEFGPGVLPRLPLDQVIYIDTKINCLTPGIRVLFFFFKNS